MRWLINIASNYFRFILSIGVMIIMTPYTLNMLGQEQYGLWVLLFSAISLVSLSDLGFATTAIKFLAQAEGTADNNQRNSTFGMLLKIYSGIALLTLLICLCLVALSWLPDHNFPGFDQLFILMGVTTAACLLLSVYRAILIATGQQHWVNHFAVFGTILQAVLTYGFLEAGMGLKGVCYANCMGLLVSSLACVPAAHLLVRNLRPTSGTDSTTPASSMLAFSAHAFLANAALMLIFRIDPFVINSMLSLADVTLLGVTLKIAEQALLFNKQFSNALTPLIAQLHGRQDENAHRDLFVVSSRYLALIAVPCMALLAFYAGDILAFWLGSDYRHGADLLRWLSIACLMSILQFNAANLLGMTGHAAYVAGCSIASALIKLVLLVLLLPVVGLEASGIAMFIGMLAGELIPSTLGACQKLSIQPLLYIRKAYLPAVLATAPCLLLAIALGAPSSLVEMITNASLCGLLAIISNLILGLDQTEKAFLRQLMPRRYRLS